MKKQRIWELDAARGFFIIGMVIIHLIYDLVDLYRIIPWETPRAYDLFKNNYGALFLVLSGISVTLGSHPVKRGLQVLLGGFACTAVTLGMYLLGAADRGIIIYFGVLHALGCCMLLWPAMEKLPNLALGILGVLLWGVGIYLRGVAFNFSWGLIFGFVPWGFASSDYFPLMPSLGYFLLGAVLGRKCYGEKKSLFPRENPPLPTLQWMGRHALIIYLLHQPILAALVGGYALLGG